MSTCPACAQQSLQPGHFCAYCGAHLGLDRASVRQRWYAWSFAVLWSIAILAVLWAFPVKTGDHPVATPLYQQGRVTFWVFVIALSVGLVVSGVDLLLRTREADSRSGVAAMVIGVCLSGFSLFGLLWGLASLGVCGGLIVLSGRSFRLSLVSPQEITRSHSQ